MSNPNNQDITLAVDDGVAVITIQSDNGKNTLTRGFFDQLRNCVEEANNNDLVSCLLITGFDQVFSAGADLKRAFLPLVRGEKLLDANDKFTGGAGVLSYDLLELFSRSKPIVTAVNGYAIGGGITAFLTSDILICSDNASFHFPFVKLGIVPELGSTKHLSDRIGLAKAKRILLTGAVLSADQACDMGLIDDVFPIDQLLSQALKICRSIAKNPSHAVKATKELLNQNHNNIDRLQVWQRESESLGNCYKHPHHHEAVNAFMDKRQPIFDNTSKND